MTSFAWHLQSEKKQRKKNWQRPTLTTKGVRMNCAAAAAAASSVCHKKKGVGLGGRAKKRLQTIPNWKLLNSAFFSLVFFPLSSLLLNFFCALAHTFARVARSTRCYLCALALSRARSPLRSLALLKCLSFVRLVQIGTWISFRMTFAPSRVNCSQRRQST